MAKTLPKTTELSGLPGTLRLEVRESELDHTYGVLIHYHTSFRGKGKKKKKDQQTQTDKKKISHN